MCGVRRGELRCQVFGAVEEYTLTLLTRLDAQGDRQMGFTDAGSAKEKNVLRLRQEVETGQFSQELLVELRLIGEVKGVQMP